MWGRIISTHALTEGDLEFFGLLKGDDISTHALTEGDHQPAATGSPVSYFNSRPHGGRLHWLFFLRTKRYFNSRPHGGRLSAPIQFYVCLTFQLTPSRRATVTYGDMSVSVPVFQLTPSRRATDGRNYESRSRKFQLTPSRRATKISAYSPDSLIFQLTPSRRATMKS